MISTDGMRMYQLSKVRDIIEDNWLRLLVLRYGAGKSWVALAANDTIHRTTLRGIGAKAIILCRLRNVDTWKAEIEKRDPDTIVRSVTDKDWLAMLPALDYLLLPHHLALKHHDAVVDFIIAHKPCGMICDESSKIKNHKTQRTEACLSLSVTHQAAVPKGLRLCMTGNATPEGAHEIWSQLQFALPHRHKLGGTFYGMLGTYFLATDRGPVLRAEMRERFYKVAGQHVCRMTPGEWVEFKRTDRLKCVYTIEQYKESAEQAEMMESLFSNWQIEHDGVLDEYNYGIQLHSKAQQFANGFWRDSSGETHWLDDNPKLDLLKDLLTDLIEEGQGKGGRQIIIWCHYKEDYTIVGRALLDAGVPFCVGPESDAIQAFATGQKPVILMPVTVSEGFNELAVADTAIYWSNVYSIESRNQSEHRIIRLNQKAEIVAFIDLCGQFSHDRRVIESLQSKQPLQPPLPSQETP